jgi:hypothetical protein
LGYFGKSPTATVAAFAAQPVGMIRTNGLDAGFNIRMKLRESGHRVAQIIIGMSMRQGYIG